VSPHGNAVIGRPVDQKLGEVEFLFALFHMAAVDGTLLVPCRRFWLVNVTTDGRGVSVGGDQVTSRKRSTGINKRG